MQDSRVMTALGVLLGVQLEMGGDEEEDMDTTDQKSSTTNTGSAKPSASKQNNSNSEAKKAPETPVRLCRLNFDADTR